MFSLPDKFNFFVVLNLIFFIKNLFIMLCLMKSFVENKYFHHTFDVALIYFIYLEVPLVPCLISLF